MQQLQVGDHCRRCPGADYICPKCHSYFRMDAWRRIETIADPDSFEVWEEEISTQNPMGYPGYEQKLQAVQEKTGLDEAVVIREGKD